MGVDMGVGTIKWTLCVSFRSEWEHLPKNP